MLHCSDSPNTDSGSNNLNQPEIILPVEIVAYIMRFLPHTDRLSSRQVCKLWNEASIYPEFLNRERIVLKRGNLRERYKRDINSFIEVFTNSNRPILNFNFVEIELEDEMLKLWKKYGSTIKSLAFENCLISYEMLIKILFCCQSLEHFEIKNCRDVFLLGNIINMDDELLVLRKILSNVKTLCINEIRYLSDSLFNKLIFLMPNLNYISLASTSISFHPGIYKKFYNVPATPTRVYSSAALLTCLNIIQYIENNSEQMSGLDFSCTLIDSKSLSQIAKMPNLKLQEIYLQNCYEISKSGILSLAEHQCSLKVLDLSGCSRLNDQLLIYICESLKGLEKLKIRKCRSLTDEGVQELKKLSKLEFLDISMCDYVSENGIELGLCASENKQLKHLILCDLNTLSPNLILSLTDNHTGLLSLDLSNCFRAVTDNSIKAIFKNLKWLRSLKLANCIDLTDAGLTGLDVHFKIKPVETAIYSSRKNSEDGFVDEINFEDMIEMVHNSIIPGQEKYSLDCLEGLQMLDIRNCYNISNISAVFAIKLKELQYLNLSKCERITDKGLLYIAKNNPGIGKINISYCKKISEDGVRIIAESFNRLRELNLTGCFKLTKEYISEFCNKHPHIYIRCENLPQRTEMTFEQMLIELF